MNCTQCGHPLESHHLFCEKCGAVHQQLPAKFAAAQQTYLGLKERYERGDLSESEFEAAVQKSMVQDADGVYWMLGAQSGRWYRYIGEQWVQANPPLIAAAPPSSSPPPPALPSSPPVAAAPPPAEKSDRKRWLVLIAAAILIGVIGVMVGRFLLTPSDSGQQAALVPTLTSTALNADTTDLSATPTAEATPPPNSSPTPTAVSETDPMATPSATAAPSGTTSTSTTPTTAPTQTPTLTPNATPTPPEIGVFLDFESDITWRRGDQPYGEFDRSDEQTMEGESAGRLSYDLPAVTANFVVFEAQPEIPLAEETTGILAWVYGDGSSHYLNAWLRDAEGERRSYTFGQISHEGWQPLVAMLDEELGWPTGHIDGPDNGMLDSPARFHALVLDGVPDGVASQGTIFIDDISTIDEEVTIVTDPTGELTPTVDPDETPTVEAPTILSGRIAFPVFAPERGVYDIYIANPDGSNMQRVADYASQPAFSPDGRRLAFRGWRGNDRGIALMDAFGGNRTRLSNFLEDALPSWRPDGQRLVFFSRRESDRKSRIYQVNASDGDDWELHQNGSPVLGEYQSWMSNGQIVYRSIWPDQGIAIMNEDGSGYLPIVKDASATAPAMSPDSNWVAFMSQRDGGWEIYKADAQGGNLTRLTVNGANDGLPTWSPDGRNIAFVSDREGGWGMWVMDENGGNQRKLFDLPGSPEGYVSNEPGFSSRGWVEERISWSR